MSLADIVVAGRRIGLAGLTMRAVATELGVTTTALYRHVNGRWELERVVGESLLADLTLRDNPALDAHDFLTSVADQLFAHVLRHSGLARYVEVLFPRGEAGHRLLRQGADGLIRRGYQPDTAVVVVTAAATLTLGYASALDERRRAEGLADQRDVTLQHLQEQGLGDLLAGLPTVSDEEYVRLWLHAALRGVLIAAPPELSAPELLTRMRDELEEN